MRRNEVLVAPVDRQRIAAEVAVIGGGPAGLTAAIALAAAGVETALVAKPAIPNHRTTALMAGSVTALDTLGVWKGCRQHAAPLKLIRIVDDTGRLPRAPEVRFAASEIGLEAFGHNIENAHLLAALQAKAGSLPALAHVADNAAAIELADDGVKVRCGGGTEISARLVVGAEGRQSLTRAAAGIKTDSWTYRQAALTLNLAHARPHRDTSTEFHTPDGPVTLVPLPGQRSSLVLVSEPEDIARLEALTDADLSAEIERRCHSIVGKIAVETGRGVFAIAAESARRLSAQRAVLVGEAAHVMPPIGAQGLNLGLRDAAVIGELVVAAHRRGGDVGSAELTAHYNAMRGADVMSRTLAVDVLNRSLLSEFLPLHGARGLGLFLLEQVGPLRRAIMREGVAPTAAQPRLMRGEAL
jgi:2-octaprenyl-6-methoxyphenol hydroxylase